MYASIAGSGKTLPGAIAAVALATTAVAAVAGIAAGIASFSTKIRNKDKERQNNISITTKKINGKEVKTGEIFSFCETVGKATAEEGYQKADIYVDGKKGIQEE